MNDEEWDRWIDTAHDSCDASHAEGLVYGAGVGDGDDLWCLFVGPDGFEELTTFLGARLPAASPRVAFIATRVMWSPTATGPSSDAWGVTMVTLDRTAHFGVRRFVEDKEWIAIDPRYVPWFMLSSAASLRTSLITGKPPVTRTTEDARLLLTPADEPNPPIQADGRL